MNNNEKCCKNRKNTINSNKKRIKNSRTNKKEYIFRKTIFVAELLICSAMFAGFLSILNDFIKNTFLSYLIFLTIFFLAFIIVCHKNNIVHFVNSTLSALLFVYIIFVFIYKAISADTTVLDNINFNWYSIFMPILYASMNMITVVSLLLEESYVIKNKKEIILTSVFVGALIFIFLAIICLLTLLYGGNNFGSEMIMIDIVSDISSMLKIIYLILICASIFTTLITTARGAAFNMGLNLDFKFKSFTILTMSFILSFLGFSKIIDYLYPMLGVACFVYFTVCYISLINKKRKNMRLSI